MKSILPILSLLVALVFFGCSKKIASEEDLKNYRVRFKTIGFTQNAADYSLSNKLTKKTNNRNVSTNLISHLYFVIFDTQGRVIQTIKQDTFNSVNFGSAEMSLPTGLYKIAVVGASDTSPTDLNKHTLQLESLEKFGISFAQREVRHTFCSDLFPFEVSADGIFEKELLIKRVSSQLDIIFENVIPDNVQYVKVEFSSILEYNFFNRNSDNFDVEHRIDFTELNGKSNVKISIPLFLGNDSANSSKVLKITLYDKNNAIVVSRFVPNIKFEKNKITEVKGNIFEESKIPFSVKISSEFDGQLDFTF